MITDPEDHSVTLVYNALHNIARIDSESQEKDMVFDKRNRLVSVSYQTSPASVRTYAYDLVGNILSVTETDSRADVAYTWDALNRLDSETSAGETHQHRYDLAGNLLLTVFGGTGRRIESAYNELNQLTAHETGTDEVAYTYDHNGNRTSRDDGTVTTAYGYDFDNRLIAVAVAAVEYEYVYDYRTRRVERTEDGVTTRIVYNGGTSVMEYTTGTPDVLTAEYVRGSDLGGGIGGLLYSVRGGVASFTHYNHRGDVVSKTDDLGDVTYQAEYEAFGEHPVETGSTADRQRANTKEEDPTGLLNEGFRYRDLETGAFLTRDPLGFVDGPNLYNYVRQNPWTSFDPYGLYDEVYKSEPDAKGVVNVRVVVPIAYKNRRGADVSPEDTARINAKISETFSAQFEHEGVKYNVSTEVRQVTRDTFPVEGTGDDSDVYVNDRDHADKYRYNLLEFNPDSSEGRWDNPGHPDATLVNHGWVGTRDPEFHHTAVHEIGHAMGLVDNHIRGNLMDNRPDAKGWGLTPSQRAHIVNKPSWRTGDVPGKPAPSGAKPIVGEPNAEAWNQRRKDAFRSVRERGRQPVPSDRNYIDRN